MAVGAKNKSSFLSPEVRAVLSRVGHRLGGVAMIALSGVLLAALMTYTPSDPSLNTASESEQVVNALGKPGAIMADFFLQSVGMASFMLVFTLFLWGGRLVTTGRIGWLWFRSLALIISIFLFAIAIASWGTPEEWPLPIPMAGMVGELLFHRLVSSLGPDMIPVDGATFLVSTLVLLPAFMAFAWSTAIQKSEVSAFIKGGARTFSFIARQGLRVWRCGQAIVRALSRFGTNRRYRSLSQRGGEAERRVPSFASLPLPRDDCEPEFDPPRFSLEDRLFDIAQQARSPVPRNEESFSATRSSSSSESETSRLIVPPSPRRSSPQTTHRRDKTERQGTLLPEEGPANVLQTPPLDLLGKGKIPAGTLLDEDALTQNARLLKNILSDFGVNGDIVHIRPGPVVTLYELEPAPGTKTSRVVGLADDIARSMSAISVRIAVVPGKSTIGIELPNSRRETVNFHELLSSDDFVRHGGGLVLALGRDIGGAPVYVDLARMPHLLIAGTTGSGKSVAVNTMVCSLLYRLTPQQCRFIMIDPKMLELSVYDGIPHLLTPVVTDPGKAVVALKWAVKEMENRYRAMSQMGVRNIAGYNQKLIDATAREKALTRTVQTGFDPETGKPIFEEQPLDTTPLPFIVVIVDEMADLMLVAGKDVEAAIQRLAQMARAAGIHLVMATQRPSVDVITGTIKANFPTRISFQVTSKIDSRTILGEQGAEQLLGQGDMLYMAAGGRITRVHGPFVSDVEVEAIAGFLRNQAEPDYIDAVTNEDEQGTSAILDMLSGGDGEDSGDDLFDQAVALVARERKASTSFIQRYLQIGYNRAARLIERMEKEGMVSRANHVGKRDVLLPPVEQDRFGQD